MSRVTSIEQYQRHGRARELFIALPQVYALLDPNEQWTIHAFYEPQRDHTPASLGVIQQAARQTDPSIPNRAGKILARIELLVELLDDRRDSLSNQATVPLKTRRKGSTGRISVFSDVVPKLDPVALASVLVQAALEAAARDRAERDDEQRSA